MAAVSRDHPLAPRRRLHWAELARHPLVVNALSGTVGPTMWPKDARPEVAVSCRTYDEYEMVAAGRGVGALLESGGGVLDSRCYIALADAPAVSLVLVGRRAGATPTSRRPPGAARVRRGAGGARSEATPRGARGAGSGSRGTLLLIGPTGWPKKATAPTRR